MAGINNGRMLLGGVVAGAVLWLLEVIIACTMGAWLYRES